jgi:hypothetical protein
MGGVSVCATRSDPYPSVADAAEGYRTDPDMWNSDGSLCLTTQGSTGFTVTGAGAFTPKLTGPPGGYPNTTVGPGSLGLPIAVAWLGDIRSDWTTTQVATGRYDTAYDLWYSTDPATCSPDSSAEVMVWLRAQGAVPLGREQPGVATLGGRGYTVYQAPIDGPHTVISYLSTRQSSSVHALDLRLITRDAELRGYVPPDASLCTVSAGFEIWSGGIGLASRAFSLSTGRTQARMLARQ